MEQIYVQTEDLSVGYHKKVLLSDIALKVNKGEILVLIGPNGAGKSTIIKNLIKEMSPIGGNIYIKGREISDYTSKEYAKTMSVVLTEKIKTEMMTCRDVVAMGRYPYTNYFGRLTNEDEQIVNESLKKVSALDLECDGMDRETAMTELYRMARNLFTGELEVFWKEGEAGKAAF